METGLIAIGKGLLAIGAGFAVFTGVMTGRGEGEVAAHACDAIGKNPEAESKIRSAMILGIALAETCAIYGLLVAILLIFVFGGSF
jgi:F-type H+-transporting ATPase subunit c